MLKKTLVVLLSVIIVSSCQDSEAPTTPTVPTPEFSVDDEVLTMSDPLDALAAKVPTFSGVYFDTDGDLVVRIVEGASNRNRDANMVADYLLDRHGPDFLRSGNADRQLGNVRLEEASRSFRELRKLQESSVSLLRLPGAYILDLDESRGQIVVIVETEGDVPAVLSAASGLGIPDDVIAVRVGGVPSLTATLSDKVRPLAGGLRIDRAGGGNCTLGFIAEWLETRWFVTNSHCTETYGAVDGDNFNQGGSFVGDELHDPAFSFLPNCPSGYDCRFSDAALVRIDANVSSGLGKIKKTAVVGSDLIVGDFTITSEGGAPTVGQNLAKMGQVTGWTEGEVTATCFEFDLGELPEDPMPNHALVCQYAGDWNSLDGDSGSPVFELTGSDEVKLHGIHWGATETGHRLFSPLTGIKSDFGLSGLVVK